MDTKKKWQVPFEFISNKIILPIRVNESEPLKMILDTGKPSTGLTLFSKKRGAELGLAGTQRIRVRGAGGGGEGTHATVAASCRLSLNDIEFQNQRVVILDTNPLRGMDADGVIGYTLFGSFVVHIDHDSRIITLSDPIEFKAWPGWNAVALTFNEKKIPFIEAGISIKTEKMTDVSLYIDLGSSEALILLVKPGMKFALPRNLWGRYSGKGMNGYMYGKFGYISALKIGPHVLQYIPAAFPESELRSRQEGADGILGSATLRRFNVIFDYSRSKLYIKPSRYFDHPFY